MITFLFCAVAIIGVLTGLRAFTPLALLCWAAYLHWIPLSGTGLAFLASIATAIIVSVIAAGELVNDKRSKTGNRTALPPLIGRIVLAGLCGAAIFLARAEPWIPGVSVAAVGALIGTFAGFHIRRSLVTKLALPALPVALVEDAITVGGAFFIVSHLF